MQMNNQSGYILTGIKVSAPAPEQQPIEAKQPEAAPVQQTPTQQTSEELEIAAESAPKKRKL